MSDLFDIIIYGVFVVIFIAASLSKRKKLSDNSQPLEQEIMFEDAFEPIKKPVRAPKTKQINHTAVKPKIEAPAAEIKPKEELESLLPDEINWQHAVIYSEILKPKFDE